MARYEFDWRRMLQEQWLENASEGYFAIKGELDKDLCDLIWMMINRWMAIPSSKPDDVVFDIDCSSGHTWSWLLSHDLVRLGCRTMVSVQAGSAGLFLFMAGEERVAVPGATFTFHGNLYRWMQSGPSDEERAEWFSERTNMSHDWWLEKAKMDGTFDFGCDEALEWGVVTDLEVPIIGFR